MAGERLGGPHPLPVDELTAIVRRRLVRRGMGHEEPGVESTWWPGWGDPTGDVVDVIHHESKVLLVRDVEEGGGPGVEPAAMVGESSGLCGFVEPDGLRVIRTVGEENPGLLERLPDRCHPEGEAVIGEVEQGGGGLIVESIDPEGPYGAKEAGEGPLHPSIPAIANAIYDAVGVRMDRLPFSPPNVWRRLAEARTGGELTKPDAPASAGVAG